jgi:hypothetical protein
MKVFCSCTLNCRIHWWIDDCFHHFSLRLILYNVLIGISLSLVNTWLSLLNNDKCRVAPRSWRHSHEFRSSNHDHINFRMTAIKILFREVPREQLYNVWMSSPGAVPEKELAISPLNSSRAVMLSLSVFCVMRLLLHQESCTNKR